MSREAQQWVAQLPAHATKTLMAFRVLDKLADAHHTDTDHAYRDNGKLADELVVSVRTVQRALRELERAQLILVGNQAVLPRTIPANRAPTAYRLPWRTAWRPRETLGVTLDVAPTEPVDNSVRGDNTPRSGVTPGVAHRTQEHLGEVVEATTEQRRCEHVYSRRFGVCIYCNAAAPEGARA